MSMAPEEIENAMFIVKWWYYLIGAFVALFGLILGVNRKNRIVPLSEKHIDNKIKICAGDLEMKVKKDFQDSLDKLKDDLLREIDLMIKAAMK